MSQLIIIIIITIIIIIIVIIIIVIAGPYLGFFVSTANSRNLHRDLPYTDRVSSQTLC